MDDLKRLAPKRLLATASLALAIGLVAPAGASAATNVGSDLSDANWCLAVGQTCNTQCLHLQDKTGGNFVETPNGSQAGA